MRKVVSCIVIILVLLLCPSVNAHPGRTDANGGHMNHFTGEYHYHGTPSSRQHNDSGSKDSTEYPYSFSSYTNDSAIYRPTDDSEDSESKTNIFIPVIVACAALFICYKVISRRSAAKEAKRKAEQEKREREQWLREKEEYSQKYKGRTLLELSNAPAGSFVGEDGLPSSPGPGKWGYLYTFASSYGGKNFHIPTCRYAKYMTTQNASSVKNLTPCKVCRPKIPDLSWFDEYQRIKAIKEKYHID